MIRFSCPSCGKILKVPDHGAGRKVACPRCGQHLLVPPPVRSQNQTMLGQALPDTPTDEHWDQEDDWTPRRRERPGKVQAIAIMILVGGIIACLKFFILDIWLGIGTVGLFCIPGIYSLVLGIMAIQKGSQLLGDKGYLQPPPRNIGIMMIVNIIAIDLINLTLGILVLVFLSDPEVEKYYRG